MKIQYNVQRPHKRPYRLVHIIPFMSGFFLLTGCSPTSETFDTQAIDGVGAKSITKVNAMVNQGEVAGLDQSSSSKVMQPVFSTFDAKKLDFEKVEISHKTITYRQPEKHQRVWVAPFQDPQGNLHEASLIHTLVGQGYWQIGNNPFHPQS